MTNIRTQAGAERARVFTLWKILALFGAEFVLLAERGKPGQVRQTHRANGERFCNYGNGNFGVLRLDDGGTASDARYEWAPLSYQGQRAGQGVA